MYLRFLSSSVAIFDLFIYFLFFFQAEDGIRDLVRSRGLGDVYKRQAPPTAAVVDLLELALRRRQEQ